MATVETKFTRRPLFMQASAGDPNLIEYDAYLMRLLPGAIWPNPGTISDGAFTVTQRATGINNSVDVSPGFAVLGGGDDKYLVHQATVLNVVLTGFVAPPAGATYVHRVFLCVFDKQRMGAGTLDPDAKVVITGDTGAGAPSPVGVDLAASLQIATITLTAGQTTVANAAILNLKRPAGFGPPLSYITISSGFVDANASMTIATPQVSRSGSTGKLQGGFRRTGLANFVAGTGYNIGVLPKDYWPGVVRYCIGTGGNVAPWRLTIQTNGVLQADIPTGYSPDWLSVDGINYELV